VKQAFGSFDDLLLPSGERVLWQGRPRARSLAIRVFHLRVVLAWFGLLFAAGIVTRARDGQSWLDALSGGARLVIPCMISVLLLAGLAWLYSRTTRYTVTSRRVLIQFGAVLPMTLTIPFAQIGSAGVKTWHDGTGDLPLSVVSDKRLAFLLLWPHVRPWRLTNVEPMLRCVPDAQEVAGILANALTAASSPAIGPAAAAASVPGQIRAVRAVATAA
jgi:hypothetical protein